MLLNKNVTSVPYPVRPPMDPTRPLAWMDEYERDSEAPVRSEYPASVGQWFDRLRAMPQTPEVIRQIWEARPEQFMGCTYYGHPVGMSVSTDGYKNKTHHIKNPRYGAPWSALFEERRQVGPPVGWAPLIPGEDYPIGLRLVGNIGRFMQILPWDVEQDLLWRYGQVGMVYAPAALNPFTLEVMHTIPTIPGSTTNAQFRSDLNALFARYGLQF